MKVRTEEELKQLAYDIDDGKIFLECYIKNRNLVPYIFLPIGYLTDAEASLKGVRMLFEYYNKAVSFDNGAPSFISMQCLSDDEVNFISEVPERPGVVNNVENV
jgi:hypothetical protein